MGQTIGPPARLDVWAWSLDLGDDEQARAAGLLTEREVARAERLATPRLRRRWIAARSRLREILASYLRAAPRELRIEDEPVGVKPVVAGPGRGPHFNLSHSGGHALLGVCLEHSVGVDVEEMRAIDVEGVSRLYFAPDEHAALMSGPAEARVARFYGCWTRKEAYVKALGRGLSAPLSGFAVSLPGDEPPRLVSVAGAPGAEERWSLVHLEPAPGYVGAAAVEAPAVAVRLRRWPESAPPRAGARREACA